MNMAFRFLSARLNALLERETWARALLVPHAGHTAYCFISPFSFVWTVQDGGRVAVTPVNQSTGEAPTVSITVPPDALPTLTQGGLKAVMRQARIEGDAEFAATLAQLAEYLRPDLEEVLAAWVGDAPAHCIGQGARQLQRSLKAALQALLQSGAEYVLEEKPYGLSTVAFKQFEADVAQLRDATERLEKRMARLEASGGKG